MKKLLFFLLFAPGAVLGQLSFSNLSTGAGTYAQPGAPTLLLQNTTPTTGRPYYLHSSNSGDFEWYSTPNSTPILKLGNLGDLYVSKRLVITEKWGASNSGNELIGRNSSGGLCKITLGSGLSLTDSTLSATGGGGSSYYQTLRLNGSAQTQRGKLNFIPSAQITWGLTDDSGNDETEVTATLAQNGATTGQVLKWSGTAWVPDNAGTASAGGSSTQVQYNSGGTLTADAGFTRDPSATTGDALLIQGNSVSSGNALEVVMNSTTATGNTQTAGLFTVSGANANSNQTTYAARFLNSHTGTGAINVGGFFNPTGGSENYSILLGPDATQYIYGARRTSDAGGSDLRIQAGGSFSGGSNRAGGNLLLSSGISTGSTGSEIQFLTATNSGSGTTDRNPTLKAVINRSGFFGLGVSSPSYLFDGGTGVFRWNGAGTATTPNSASSFCIQNNSSGFAYAEIKNASTSALFFGAISSGGAGRIGWHGTGGLNFNSAPGLNPSTVYNRFQINDTGDQPYAWIGGGTSADGAQTYISSGMFSATGTATVASTTTETTVLGSVNGTKTLPANLFRAGKKVTVRVTGTIGSTASAPTLNVRLKFGSTTIAETGAQTIGTDIDGTRRFVAEFEVTCRSTGASGTLQAGGEFRYFESGTAQKFWECPENLVSSFNTTTTHVVDVTATWNTNDANNTIAGTQAILIIED